MPIERPHDTPLGMPSSEAVQMAADAIRRRYVLPETMQHPQVRSECMRLAYLIQSYGLTTAKAEPRHIRPDKPLYAVSPRQGPTPMRSVVRIDRTRELAEA
jgi:hypothetical protein